MAAPRPLQQEKVSVQLYIICLLCNGIYLLAYLQASFYAVDRWQSYQTKPTKQNLPNETCQSKPTEVMNKPMPLFEKWAVQMGIVQLDF